MQWQHPGLINSTNQTLMPTKVRPIYWTHGLAVPLITNSSRSMPLHPPHGMPDAWATALMILGPEEGMKMAEKMDMVARFCLLKDDEFLILKSTAYDRIFTKLTPN
jgi:hypothetical protein